MGAIPSGADPTGWSALTGANPQAGYDATALEGSLVAGGISALAGRTQLAVMNAKAAEISVNALWKSLSDAFFAGLTPDGLAHLPVLIIRAVGAALGIDVSGWIELVDATAGLASFLLNLPAEVAAQLQALIDYLWNALTGQSGITGKTATQVFTALEAVYLGSVTVISDVATLLNYLYDILTGGIGSTGKSLANVLTAGNAFYATLAGAVVNFQTLLNNLFDAFNGTSGATGKDLAGVLAAGSAFYTAIRTQTITGWAEAMALVGATTPDQFVGALRGIVAAAQRDVDGTMAVIGTGVANFVDNANGTWSFVVGQGEADVAGLVQGADGAVYTAAQIAQQAVAAAAAAGVGVGQAISSGQQMVDHGIAAITGEVAQVGQEAHEFAAAMTAGYTSWLNAWTGSSATSAAAAEIARAAAAAKKAADYQIQQANGILSLIPHFYGGSGTSGLPLQSVPFSGALPASFTSAASIATNSAVYNVAAAATDQETVSAFWNTPLSASPGSPSAARYLFLRGNIGLTTYLYLKYYLEVTLTNDSIVHVEIGCVVAGFPHVLGTASVTGGNPFLASVVSGPQAWALEATGNAITLTGPGGYSFSTIDGSPGGAPVVSQFGASYRSAGIGSDETSWLSTISSWNFYDSGPTVGPDKAEVATPESTGSTTFANLATNHQAVVNIGISGMAHVFISADASNDGGYSDMSYELSGANTRAASSSPAARGSAAGTISLAYLETGLLPGPTDFTAKHRADPGGGHTATFEKRRISVTPL